MKKIIVFSIWVMVGMLSMNAQELSPLAQEILNEQSKRTPFQSTQEVFSESSERPTSLDSEFNDPSQVAYLDYDFAKLPESGQAMRLEVPSKEGILNLLLVELIDPFDHQLKTETGEVYESRSKQRFYRGIIEDNPNSLVAISFFPDNVMGIVSDGNGNYELGKSGNQDTILFFDENNIKNPNDFACDVPDSSIQNYDTGDKFEKNMSVPSVSNCVGVYFEVEHDIYTHFGGDMNDVDDYINGMFHQVAILYFNENISMKISDVKVWTIPDPYDELESEAYLNEFRAESGAFIGDVAQLITFRYDPPFYVGRAGVDTLCRWSYDDRKSVAQVTPGFNGVPNLGITLRLVTHELGHLLGSPHTQACVWYGSNNWAIDGCGPIEGTCPDPGIPLNGGTIMSYCNTIPFTNGFGAQPGNLIRSRVAGARCLSNCSIDCENLCDIDPEIQIVPWSTIGSPCRYKFIGSNFINPMCDALYEYEWRIQGLLPVASTAREFIYDFSSWDNGTYNVTLTMTYNDPSDPDCTFSEETVVVPITISCGINNNPTCPTNNFFLNQVEPCLDYQVNMMTNTGVASIDWSYSICGLPGEQPFGTTTGTHHVNYFTLPSGNDYDFCYLWVHADINLTNGVVCEKSRSMLLDCPSGPGGGSKIALVPNPTRNAFSVHNHSKLEMNSVEVRNLQGLVIQSRTSELNSEFNLSTHPPGIYLVSIQLTDGSTLIKKLILEK